jgi:predicted helicase
MICKRHYVRRCVNCWLDKRFALPAIQKKLIYSEFLTLEGIPPERFEYRLGGSALEWVIDQYQVSTEKRRRITNHPNRPDDPESIVRLPGQVIARSLETVRVVKSLPAAQSCP